MREKHGLSKEASRELFETVVPGTLGAEQDLPYVVAQLGLAPIIPGRLFGAGCLSFARSLEQYRGRCGVEPWIVARRQSIALYWSAGPGVFIYESSRHGFTKSLFLPRSLSPGSWQPAADDYPTHPNFFHASYPVRVTTRSSSNSSGSTDLKLKQALPCIRRFNAGDIPSWGLPA